MGAACSWGPGPGCPHRSPRAWLQSPSSGKVTPWWLWGLTGEIQLQGQEPRRTRLGGLECGHWYWWHWAVVTGTSAAGPVSPVGAAVGVPFIRVTAVPPQPLVLTGVTMGTGPPLRPPAPRQELGAATRPNHPHSPCPPPCAGLVAGKQHKTHFLPNLAFSQGVLGSPRGRGVAHGLLAAGPELGSCQAAAAPFHPLCPGLLSAEPAHEGMYGNPIATAVPKVHIVLRLPGRLSHHRFWFQAPRRFLATRPPSPAAPAATGPGGGGVGSSHPAGCPRYGRNFWKPECRAVLLSPVHRLVGLGGFFNDSLLAQGRGVLTVWGCKDGGEKKEIKQPTKKKKKRQK